MRVTRETCAPPSVKRAGDCGRHTLYYYVIPGAALRARRARLKRGRHGPRGRGTGQNPARCNGYAREAGSIGEGGADPDLARAAATALQASGHLMHLVAPPSPAALLKQHNGLQDDNLAAAEAVDPHLVPVAKVVA